MSSAGLPPVYAEHEPPAEGPHWSRIAQEAGYADQSHMVGDFGELVGIAPARWYAERPDRVDRAAVTGSQLPVPILQDARIDRHYSGARPTAARRRRQHLLTLHLEERPPMSNTIRKLTPVLVVEEIEPSLSFWTERLGFEKTVEVPHGDRLGFVILVKDGIEVMYQSRESVRSDVPKVAEARAGESAVLFIEVADVEAIARAVNGMPVVVPRRTTFYGMDEIGVREPGGHVVMFAQPVPQEANR